MLKHIVTFFVLLLVLLAIFVTAERKFSPSFQSCIGQQVEGQQLGADSNDLGTVAAHYAACTGQFVDTHGVGIAALASLVVAALTGTLWIASSRQGQLMFDSLELARKEFVSTHRPRIVIRFIQGPLRDPKDNEVISVTIANVGGSPATVDAIGGDLARRNKEGKWVSPGLNATPKSIHPVTLISGQRYTFTVTAKQPYTEISAEAVDEHELCAVGAVNYRDGNRVFRETGFFRIYDESSGSFIAPNNSEFEYQD
jgi:hypothetical protein